FASLCSRTTIPHRAELCLGSVEFVTITATDSRHFVRLFAFRAIGVLPKRPGFPDSRDQWSGPVLSDPEPALRKLRLFRAGDPFVAQHLLDGISRIQTWIAAG